MIGSAPFPVSLNDLTTEVLSRALGVEILDFEAEPLGLDRGMLCELFLLDLRYGGAAHGRLAWLRSSVPPGNWCEVGLWP